MSTLIEQLEYIKYFLEHRDLDEGKRWDKAKKAIAGGVLAGVASTMSIPSTDVTSAARGRHAQTQRKIDKMSVGDKKRMILHPKPSDRREPSPIGSRHAGDTFKLPSWPPVRKPGEPWKEKLGTRQTDSRKLLQRKRDEARAKLQRRKYLKGQFRAPLKTQDDPRKFQLKNPNKKVK